MITLIKLELKSHNMRAYILAGMVIAVTMLGFLYLFAYAPQLEPDDKDMKIFAGYNNLIPLFSVLNMAVYCVLSAVLSSKLIIEDYSGKRPILLFSYPVSRKKMMLSKLCVVGLFTMLAMMVGNLIAFVIFGATESFFHLVGEPFTASVMAQAVETTLLLSLVAASVGAVAAGIGFIKKSVLATIVTAVLIASLLCNVVVQAVSSRPAICIFGAVMFLTGAAGSWTMINKANRMETE